MDLRLSFRVRINHTFLATLLASICLVTSGIAQVATTGKITGVVTDPSGAVLANATVTATSPALFAKRTTTTHADGSYLLDLLPPGEYDVTVSQTGFRAFTQTGIVLTAGFTATVSPKLQVGEVSQAVTGKGEPTLDLQNNQTTTTFDQSPLQNIPSGRVPCSPGAKMP